MNLTVISGLISKYLYWLSIPNIIGFSDLLEIAIISVVVYQIIKWFQVTRAWTLFKGIMILLGFAVIAAVLQLNTILWLLANSLSVGITAVFIIFQPELRRALEQLGRNNILKKLFNTSAAPDDLMGLSSKSINEICKAAAEMSRAKTGALIVIEDKVALGDYERTGINVDAVISSQLLINIFEHNTPLHDGAVIIRDNRIVCATSYLPLSENMNIGKELGTRHRAALGISEVSDSTTIVVSEETGAISVAKEGVLTRDLNKDLLKEKLGGIKNEAKRNTVINRWKERIVNNEKTDNE